VWWLGVRLACLGTSGAKAHSQNGLPIAPEALRHPKSKARFAALGWTGEGARPHTTFEGLRRLSPHEPFDLGRLAFEVGVYPILYFLAAVVG
jgi:hypothetical protein